MAKFYNSFKFVGDLGTPKDEKKLYEVKKFDSGWENHKLTVAVKESNTNSVFLDAVAMYNPKENNKVYSVSKDGSKLEIPFADRNKQSTLEMISDMKKFVIDLETDQDVKEEYIKLYFKIRANERKMGNKDTSDSEKAELKEEITKLNTEYKNKAINRYEFITEYDFINFIKDNLGVIKQNKVSVTGNVVMSEYKGKYYIKYVPNRLEIVDKETPNELSAKLDIFFDKNSMDAKNLKEDKKIYIDGYLMNYDRNAKADRYYPKQFIINATALDFDNEIHMKALDFRKSLFEVSGKTFYHLPWEVKIYRGAEIVEFSADSLTAQQKALVDLGLKKVEDFKPAKGVLGNSIEEVRVSLPILTGDFNEGAVNTELKASEFEELIACSSADVDEKDVKVDKKQDTEDNKEEKKDESLNSQLIANLFN